ncbi:hypothetical protein NL676_005829 [Syzygium grande]|nr:hypothetical protein NL676_005829 [Syzygium grande]
MSSLMSSHRRCLPPPPSSSHQWRLRRRSSPGPALSSSPSAIPLLTLSNRSPPCPWPSFKHEQSGHGQASSMSGCHGLKL